MADTTTAFGGLLGMDPDTLQQLAQQFGPSDADKKQALAQGLMAAGFGILGGHGIVNALGNAGQGITQYNTTLHDLTAQRSQGLQQAMNMWNLQQQQAKLRAGLTLMGMRPDGTPQGQSSPQSGAAPQPQGPPQTYGAGVSQSFGMAPNTPVPAPPSQNATATAFPGFSAAPGYATPQAQLGAAFMGMKDVADVIGKQRELTVGKDGLITQNGMLVGRALPQGIMVYPGGDPSKPQFYADPQQARAAVAQAAGEVTAAQEQNKIVSVTGPDKRTTTGYAGNVLGAPPGSAPGAGAPPAPNAFGQLPGQPANAAAMGAQATNIPPPGGPPQPQGAPAATPGQQGPGVPFITQPGGITGPDPVEVEREKAQALAGVDIFKGQYQQIDADANKATQLRGRIAMAMQLLNQFNPNMLAPDRLKMAQSLQSLLPDGDPSSQGLVNAVAGGDMNAMLAFQGMMKRNSIQNTLSDMGGVPRNYMEVATELQSNAGLQLPAAADKLLLTLQDATAQRMQDKQVARDTWLAGNGDPSKGPVVQPHRDLTGFETNFNQTKPATMYLPTPETMRAQLGLPQKVGIAGQPGRTFSYVPGKGLVPGQ